MRILFLCVANSARSQMAEHLARLRYGDRVFVESAGSEPTAPHPVALQVLQELGCDVAKASSQSIRDVDLPSFDLIITLCADEVCPAVLGLTERYHWPFADPAGQGGDEQVERNRFREIRDAIDTKLGELASLLPQGC